MHDRALGKPNQRNISLMSLSSKSMANLKVIKRAFLILYIVGYEATRGREPGGT